MRRDLEHRPRRLETATGPAAIELWITQDDGTLCGPSGERMTRKAFFRLRPPGSPGVVVISSTDAQL
jgi:hypothetical protein